MKLVRVEERRVSFGESACSHSTKGESYVNFNFIYTKIGYTRTVAGIIGGIPFGILMGMMGMMPMIGMLVRVDSAFAGVLVHAAISAITGAIYGFFAVRFPLTWRNAILGMFQNIFVIGQMQWMSLLGHILFGEVLALSFLWLYRRAI